MRVLVVHSFYRVAGGEDRYVQQQVELLSDHHTVRLLAAQNEELASGPSTAVRMTISPTATRRVETEIRRFRPDIIHLHNAYPSLGPAVHLAAKRFAVPLVMTVHNLRLRCPNGLMFTEGEKCRRCEPGNYANAIVHECFPSRFQAAGYAVALWTHRYILRLENKVHTFIAPSSFVRGKLEEWGIPAARTRTIRNFVTLPDKASQNPGSYGVYIGRLSAEKGVNVLLDSLAVAGDPPFKIVGDGPLRDRLIRRADELRLGRTEFTGRLTSEDVRRILDDATFLAMPSVCDDNAPVAVMEAMAGGRPVLVTSSGGLPELVAQGGGLVCEPGDAHSLANYIHMLMTDTGLCASLGIEARAIAGREFSTTRHVSQLEDVYEKAII